LYRIVHMQWQSETASMLLQTNDTVKPFNLTAIKVSDFACKIILAPFILAPFILANSNDPIPKHELYQLKIV